MFNESFWVVVYILGAMERTWGTIYIGMPMYISPFGNA